MMREAATAGDLCTRQVVVAPPSLSVDEAARVMRERHVGCIVVVEQGDGGRLPIGILTDRDIVLAVVAKDADAKTLRIGDVMTATVASVRESDTLYDVLSIMRSRGVRRVPVTGPQAKRVERETVEMSAAAAPSMMERRRGEERRRWPRLVASGPARQGPATPGPFRAGR